MNIPYSLLAVILIFFFCLIMGIFWLIFRADWRHRLHLAKRLDHLKGIQALAEGSLLKTEATGLLPFFGTKIAFLERVEKLMVAADMHAPVGFFIMISLVLALVGLTLGVFKWGFYGGLIGGLIGLGFPHQFLRFKKKRRLRKFEKQLPDAMDLISRGLKAGHGFASGLQLAATEMPDPVGMEFFQTYKEYNHGLDLNLAMINLCNRVELRDLRFFTTAVMIQRETGGSLAEILEKGAALIRERFKLRGQIKALTGEGRLSGLILILLPPVTALMIFLRNPTYVMTLIEHPLGRMMAGFALLLQLLGMLWIRHIVNIKV